MSKNGSRTAWQKTSGTAITQAVMAVSISALAYLGLIYFEQHYGPGLRYGKSFFSHWTELLCLLLIGWSLILLFARWSSSRKKSTTVARSTLPAVWPAGDDNYGEVLARLREIGRKYGDSSVVQRAERLVEEFRLSRDPVAVANALTAESDGALVELESSYTPVRIFVWTIPILGLIGTVLGIGQALGNFAIFLATGSQRPEAVRAALYEATFNLGVAFEATLVAVLLTCVVSVAYLLLLHREKTVLRDVDRLFRTRLLPLMHKESSAGLRQGSSSVAAFASDAGGNAPDTEHIRTTLVELRNAIGEVNPVLRQLADRLREEAGETKSGPSVAGAADEPHRLKRAL